MFRPLAGGEFDDFFDFIGFTFHETLPPESREVETALFEPERSIIVFDGDAIVGSTAIYTRDLTVPGNRPLPVACVTAVAVATTHTRRGMLTELMRRQLTGLHTERREPVAILWASESAIYGRFGYGLSNRYAEVGVNTRAVRLNVTPQGRIRLGDPADPAVRAEVAAVYERIRTRTVGHLDRRGHWWDYRLHDPESDRDGRTALRLALHEGAAGVDGYALYRIRKNWSNGPNGEVRVIEQMSETAEAREALWAFLLRTDLVATVVWTGPSDTPLIHRLDHTQRVEVTLYDNIWVRVVDVDRALASRTYSTPVDVILEVADAFCPWNAGRWRLAGGIDGARCERTDAPADLALTSTDLGAAYLGGSTLTALATAGRVRELRPGTLRPASIAFAEARQPNCPEGF